MDLSKAFDTLNHNFLLAKLNACGFFLIRSNLFKSICRNNFKDNIYIINSVNGEILLVVPKDQF